MASEDWRRSGFVALQVALAAAIVATGGAVWFKLDAVENARRAFAVQVLKENPMSKTRCWKSGEDTIRVSTEGGVVPPMRLCDLDDDDLTNETEEHFNARHAARCAAALASNPKTGDC